jgi:hypothetical protein
MHQVDFTEKAYDNIKYNPYVKEWNLILEQVIVYIPTN